jgi:hypothetical protein
MLLLQSVLRPRPRGFISRRSGIQAPLGQFEVADIGQESNDRSLTDEYGLIPFDKDFINVAQIITEQITFATLGIPQQTI